MNEENDQNIIDNNQPIPPPPGIRKLLHKGKKARKECFKKCKQYAK